MPAQTKIDIREGTLGIADQSFYGCNGMSSVAIPNSINSIGSDAFYGCNSLQKVLVSDITAWCGISFGDNPLSYAHHLYCDEETEITELFIPEGVTSIESNAFKSCFALTTVSFPNSLINIGNYAFQDCSGLTSVTFPESLTYIGYSAFESCNGLTSISVETGNPIYDSRNNCNAIIETATNTLLVGCMNTIIPNSVTSIGNKAFYHCSSLTSINIPSGVTSIGNYAFSYCSGLTDVYCYAEEIPSTSYAFEYSNIKSATLHVPGKVMETYRTTSPWSEFGTIVPIGPFFADANVEAICVTNWDTDGDSYLSYQEAKAVTTIGSVFKDKPITSFNEFQFFTSVTNIDDFAFSGCSNMTSISIPNSVYNIGDFAFYGCSSLTEVYCYAEEVPNIGNNAFNGTNTVSATLHVPAVSIDSYWTASPWDDFGLVMAIDSQEIYYTISDGTTSLNVSNMESKCKARFTHAFNGEWEALYLPFAIDYDAIKADFDLAEIDGVVQNDENNDGTPDITVLSIMGFKEQMTEPNTPYLIRAKNTGEQTLQFDDVTVYPTSIETIDCSSTSTKYEFTGSYNALNASDLANCYTVQSGELVKGASSLAPCRWYMTATARKGNLNLPNRIRIMSVEDVITGVSSLGETEEGAAIYNLSGQRLNKMQKGINIKEGKKIFVK